MYDRTTSMSFTSRISVGVFLHLLVLSACADQGDPCFTPDNKPGSCVAIDDCPSLLNILKQRPIPPADLDFLRESSCGYTGVNPNVCCKDVSTATQAPNTNTGSGSGSTITTGSSSDLLPSTTVCGISQANKIYGGEATDIDEFPWMALLEYKKPVGRGFYCGGVLISKRYVLTAAHCVKGKDIPKTWSLVSVRLGEYDTEKEIDCQPDGFGGEECAPAAVDISIEEQFAHEDYVPTNLNQYHDIALLRLSRDVAFSDFIRPICLPEPDYKLKSLYVAGWGKTESKSESNVKLKVQVPVVEQNQCTPTYQRASVNLRTSQLCAGGESGKDSCRGDSGGPLMTSTSPNNQPNRINWYAVGIVSFGPSPCGMRGWPGVYTKVADYKPWIVSKLRP